MAEQINLFEGTEQEGSRFGFVADLAFVLCFVWLILWRAELYAAGPDSVWAGAWPALFLAALVAVAFVIGMLQRRSQGFLPVMLRWGLLVACLILPAWIALSAADLRTEVTLQRAAEDLRASSDVAPASTPEAQRERKATKATADAIERLGRALDAAKERGIGVPHQDLAALGFDPAAVAQLSPKTKKTLEQAAGLAAVQAGTTPSPPGFSDLLREFGLDDPLIQKALLGLAAATLGPLLGLSPALVEAVLAALLIDGGLSFENILQVTLALGMSTTKTGKLSATKFKSNLKLMRQGAAVVEKIHGALKQRGAADSEGMKAFGEAGAASESDRIKISAACASMIEASKPGRAVDAELRQTCPELSPEDLRKRLKGKR